MPKRLPLDCRIEAAIVNRGFAGVDPMEGSLLAWRDGCEATSVIKQ
jgi:hypothetical protein